MMKRTYAMALALAATGLVLSPAVASAEEVRTASVTFSDLDMSSDADRAKLDQRIERAARYVCYVDVVNTGTRIRSNSARECVAAERERITQQLSEAMAS